MKEDEPLSLYCQGELDINYDLVRKKLGLGAFLGQEGEITRLAMEAEIWMDRYSNNGEGVLIMPKIEGERVQDTKGDDLYWIHITKLYLEDLNRLYAKGIVHCDAKLDNALYHQEIDRLTLIDFGMSYLNYREYKYPGCLHSSDFKRVKESLCYIASQCKDKENKEFLSGLSNQLCQKKTSQRISLLQADDFLSKKENSLKTEKNVDGEDLIQMVQSIVTPEIKKMARSLLFSKGFLFFKKDEVSEENKSEENISLEFQ